MGLLFPPKVCRTPEGCWSKLKLKEDVIFSDKNVRLGACAPNHKHFYQKKNHIYLSLAWVNQGWTFHRFDLFYHLLDSQSKVFRPFSTHFYPFIPLFDPFATLFWLCLAHICPFSYPFPFFFPLAFLFLWGVWNSKFLYFGLKKYTTPPPHYFV